MHFLCLHGAGTNNKIFDLQTATLRHELGDHHTYEFVEGTVPWPMAPGISSISNSGESYYSYFDPEAPTSVLDALHSLDAYIQAEGHFDGVLGFSQGAYLAAIYVVWKAQQDGTTEFRLPFSCLLLFSAVRVHNPRAFEERGEIEVLDPNLAKEFIQIPTVLIWGSSDEWKEESVALSKLCNPRLTTVFVHSGGHEIPGMVAKGDITAVVKAMRRGIFEAQFCT
ncbi:uncharacterized protein LY89DRAFT_753811 [Mollisia scopiformis]|uniref:Serine hydrolase domain-containing protein n=1 Tax=Mollisia scopiformis TaxID=149040 RepID=A0A194WZ70_MOLSC|nr:uncharacterized protein LY89DRAFT_753811 [Mollisia scopiformis]KUJ13245.1 hypothetical protein LY89DRAFT_753811 [Mollisia scopiformis]